MECLIKEKEMAVATDSPAFVVTLHWPISDDQFAKLCALNPEMRSSTPAQETSSSCLQLVATPGT
jgi:hypothetical protein